jgi:hypothetical protein
MMFLRMLEYYRGIMFLTTNRVNDFDEAMAKQDPSRDQVSAFEQGDKEDTLGTLPGTGSRFQSR